MSRLPSPVWTSVAGLLMGGADAVPGVSGGTIALILGIYERFINSLGVVVRFYKRIGHSTGRTELARAFQFLIPLGIGILIAYYLATKLLVGPKESPGVMLRLDTAPMCYGFFFGLVLFSVREPWKRIGKHQPHHYAAAVLGCVCAAIFVGLPHSAGTPPSWTLLLGGAGAIAVMLLPGVSGSLFLVIIGQYALVAGAIHDRELGLIALFAAGIGLGVIGFVPLLRYMVRSHHDLTMSALTGLMAGSLRALWPWKDNYNPKLGPTLNQGVGDHLIWVVVAVAAGAGVVLLLTRLERRLAPATQS